MNINNKYKKIIIIALVFLLLIFILLLNPKNNNKISKKDSSKSNNNIEKNSLVLFFSVTNNTKTIANYIKDITNSDIIEIIPKDKYTNADINYSNRDSRATKEQNDNKARPKIKNNIDIENYDTIYLGYPIWWGDVPKIILTLLDNYNFENKTIIPFCTSGSTDIANSINTLRDYNNNLNIIDGKRFSNTSSKEDVQKWINNLNI